MLTELRTKSQITIPKDIVMKMGLREATSWRSWRRMA